MTAEAAHPSPAAAALHGLLDNALADGHTVVPVTVARSVLSGVQLRLENAMRDLGPTGSAVVSMPTPSLLGFRRVVDAEHLVAAALSRFACAHRLHVVAGPPGAPRDAAVSAAGGGVGGAAVADDAEYLDIETLAAFFATCEDDETVVLAGDLDGLGSPGAGRGFADIAASGLADVARVGADPALSGAVLRDFAAAIGRGELPRVDDPTHELVIVAASSGAEAAHRVGQLVTNSIPRVLGIDAAEIQVLTPTVAGSCGTRALAAPLHAAGAPSAMTVHESLGRRWPAVVLVLAPESSGVLSRPLLYSAVNRARRHLSIVQAAGAAPAEAVSTMARRRRTLLPSLLADYSSSGSHSSSSSSLSSSVSTGPNGVTSSYAENKASS